MRPARPDETPKFGQVWSWTRTGVPLMSVVEDEAGTVVRRWKFLWLVIDADNTPILESWNWADVDGGTYDDWLLLDE